MEINMTNPIKPSAKDIKFWEDIKQRYLDRADIINEMHEDEIEAAQGLRYSSFDLAEYVSEYLHFKYDDLANFVKSYGILKDDFYWHTSECKEKLEIMKFAGEVVYILRDEYCELSTKNVACFDIVSGRIQQLFDTKPNQHQMKNFEEHGIVWEGEVDGY